MDEREKYSGKSFRYAGAATFLLDFMSVGGAFCLLTHLFIVKKIY